MMSGQKPHTHSLAALKIVESLVVGVVNHQTYVRDTPCKITSNSKVNAATTTFELTQIDGQITQNWKKWYNDTSLYACHFLVYAAKNPQIKRHYTICNCMRPAVLNALRELSRAIIRGEMGAHVGLVHTTNTFMQPDEVRQQRKIAKKDRLWIVAQ